MPLIPGLPLNSDQSELLSAPRADADAVGKLNVWVLVPLEILKSAPLVPTAKVCAPAVKPFRLVIPLPVLGATKGVRSSVIAVIELASVTTLAIITLVEAKPVVLLAGAQLAVVSR